MPETKICLKCNKVKPISEFYKRPKRPCGYRANCKACEIAYRHTEKGKTNRRQYDQSEKGIITHKRYRQSERGRKTQRLNEIRYKAKNPEKRKAKDAVHNAIIAGKLKPANNFQCSCCPKQTQEYHHHRGYEPEHWLDVIPVCQKCHKKLHLSLKFA